MVERGKEWYNERKRAWESEALTQRAAKCNHKLCLWYNIASDYEGGRSNDKSRNFYGRRM